MARGAIAALRLDEGKELPAGRMQGGASLLGSASAVSAAVVRKFQVSRTLQESRRTLDSTLYTMLDILGRVLVQAARSRASTCAPSSARQGPAWSS